MLIESDKLVASDNQYITNKGMVIAFSSEKKFDDFIKVFDKNLVDNFLIAKAQRRVCLKIKKGQCPYNIKFIDLFFQFYFKKFLNF